MYYTELDNIGVDFISWVIIISLLEFQKKVKIKNYESLFLKNALLCQKSFLQI